MLGECDPYGTEEKDPQQRQKYVTVCEFETS